MTAFGKLSTVFPTDVSVALADAGIADPAGLAEQSPPWLEETLRQAGIESDTIRREKERFASLKGHIEKGVDPKSITGITLDLSDQEFLSETQRIRLKRAGIETLGDWAARRSDTLTSPKDCAPGLIATQDWRPFRRHRRPRQIFGYG